MKRPRKPNHIISLAFHEAEILIYLFILELYPTKQQNHQKTPKVQKIRPSIGEVRDPVKQFQRIENAPSTAETVSSPSDGEESGDMIFKNASLVKFARRKARRRSTMVGILRIILSAFFDPNICDRLR